MNRDYLMPEDIDTGFDPDLDRYLDDQADGLNDAAVADAHFADRPIVARVTESPSTAGGSLPLAAGGPEVITSLVSQELIDSLECAESCMALPVWVRNELQSHRVALLCQRMQGRKS